MNKFILKNFFLLIFFFFLIYRYFVEKSDIEGLWGLQNAENLDEVISSFQKVTTPSLSFLYATKDNHIGFLASG
jgi:acyl-homoserine lactone acylase PvdQ